MTSSPTIPVLRKAIAVLHAVAEAWELQTPQHVWERVRQVRAEGVAYGAGHYHARLQTVSAPVRTGKTEVFCALTLLGWPEDFEGARLAAMKTRLRRTAAHCGKFSRFRKCHVEELSAKP